MFQPWSLGIRGAVTPGSSLGFGAALGALPSVVGSGERGVGSREGGMKGVADLRSVIAARLDLGLLGY
jgi:hypothetical protein